MGIASRLVRAYLRQPLTPLTEALAAMGGHNPFFEHAGMRRVPVRVSRRDQRLERDLSALGLQPWLLAAPWALPPRLRRSKRLARAIRRWAMASAATRTSARSARLASLMVKAAAIAAPRSVWVHGQITPEHAGRLASPLTPRTRSA
jgi:hypothetical protein